MNLLIKNTRLIDKNIDFIGDIYIENGLIKSIGKELDYKCEIVDGSGLVTMPAFIELHAHLRSPGFEYKEDIESGSKSALKGGYTTVNAMGNTNPPASSMDIIEKVQEESELLDLIDVYQTATLTKNFDGKTLSHLDKLNDVKFVSEDGFGISSSKVLYNALLKSKEKNFIIMIHAEDMDMSKTDYRIAENLQTIRDIYLAKATNAKLHFSHVSTKEAIAAIRKAKNDGVDITCEVTPHHIALSNNEYKVNPPIREKEDIEEIIKGIKDGTVDAIATDHAPHSKEDKNNGAPGMIGFETAFLISYTKLVKGGHISLNKLSELMSYNPAKIMDINKGCLNIDYDGDLVLLDPTKKVKIDEEAIVSKSKNTPFIGESFFGDIKMTIKKGIVKYKK